MPTTEELLDNLTQPASVYKPPEQLPTIAQQRSVEQQQQDAPKASAKEFFGSVVDRDFILSAGVRAEREVDPLSEQTYIGHARTGFVTDPKWSFPDFDSKEGKAAWAGVNPEDYEQFASARSQEHFDYLKEQYRKNNNQERTIASWGVPGAAARFLTDIADPVALVASVSTGPLAYSSKANRLKNAVRSGLVAAGTNAALEASVASGTMDHDATDVAVAGLFGMALGAPAGALFRPSETAAMKTTYDALARRVMASEAAGIAGVSEKEALERLASGLPRGGDSAGAARASIPELDQQFSEYIDDSLGEKPAVGKTAFAGARFDYAATLRGDEDEFVRNSLGPLVSDPIGPADRSINVVGATEIQSRISKIAGTEITRESDKQYQAWLKATQRDGLANRHVSPALRDEFMTEVGRLLNNVDGEYSPQAKALAAKLKASYARYGDSLVETGVLDEKLADFGMPQRPRGDVIAELDKKYGTQQLTDLVQEGLKNTWLGRVLMEQGAEQGAKAMLNLARGYLQRVWNVARGVDVEALHGISQRDVGYVEDLLKDVGSDVDQIRYVVDSIKRSLSQTSKDDVGKPSLAKHRTQFDMNAGLHLAPVVGGEREFVPLHQLFEQNAEIVFHQYNRAASGRLAIAKATGFKKDADFDRALNAAKTRIADESRREKVIHAAQDAYNNLVGRPLEANPTGAYARLARGLRNYNMARVGSTFGMAQIGDLGNVVAVGGMRGLIAGIPQFRSILRQIRTGDFDKRVVKELAEVAGLGMDHSSTSLYSSEYAELFATRAGKLDFGLRAASRGVAVASGMTKINTWSQVLVGRLIVNRFAKTPQAYSAQRLASLGLSEADSQAIHGALRTHGTRSGGSVEAMNLHAWNDQSLANRFVTAIRREASAAIQENDFGATMPWMHTTTGKLISQFRSFMLVAWSKQTLRAAHLRDWEAFSSMAWGMFFGGLSYVAYAATNTPADKLEDRLTPANIAKASFARAGWSSVMPMLVDTPLTFLGHDPAFAYRASGLPSNSFSGISTVELADRVQRAASGTYQAAIGEKDFTQKDLENYRRMLIGSNFWGASHLWSAVGEGLNLDDK